MSAQKVEELIYHNKKKITVTSDDIPTLVPAEVMNTLLGEDSEPYYKIEAIDYPANGSGGIYEGSFFNSFIGGLKERPYPGSKRGHEYTSRPSSDFYTVGGSVVPKDENSGTAYLKIYIPRSGDPTENSGFIRDAKAGIVNFSLVTQPEYNVTQDKDGNSTRHFTASKGFERNDAVEYGAGAMDQQVNSKNFDEEYNQTGPVDAYRNFHSARVRDPSDFKQDGAWANKTIDKAKGIQLVMGQLNNPPKGQEGSMVAQAYRFPISKFSPDEAKAWCKSHDIKFIKFTVGKDYKKNSCDIELAKCLINDGHYKRTGKSDCDIIQNGVVMRPVLRAMLSRADVENKSELSELVSMIDRNHNGGKKNMDEELETIKNGLDNGAVNINAVAEKLGIAGKLRNADDEKNAGVVKELNSLLGNPADLVAAVKSVKEANAATEEIAVENAVIQAFGQPKVKNGKNEDIDNKCYIRAMELCANKKGDELTKAIENAKNDVFIKDELSTRADNNSDFNTIVDNKNDKDTLEQNGAFVL